MKTSLTSGLEKDQATIVRQEFLGAPNLRKRLIEILDKRISSKYMKMEKNDAYKNTDWNLEHADSIGSIKAYRELISLLTNEEK